MLSIHNIFISFCFISSAAGTWNLFRSEEHIEGRRNPLTTAIAGGVIPIDGGDGHNQIPYNYQQNEGYGNHHQYSNNIPNRFNGMNPSYGHGNNYEHYNSYDDNHSMNLVRALQGMWQWLRGHLSFPGNEGFHNQENHSYHYKS